MRTFTALFTAAILLFSPSCSTVQTARDKLAGMSDGDYTALVNKTLSAGVNVGDRLALISDPNVKTALKETITQLVAAINTDTLDVQDVVAGVLDRFGSQLAEKGLDPKYQNYIREGAKVIDAAVGQIRLGIDGKISVREKGLLVAFLSGMELSLS
jgi:hypothetical protein